MRALLALMLLFAAPVLAQEASLANRQLSDAKLEAEAMTLMETIRCIQCQGQSIADSDAPIAGAMRNEVRQRMQKGESADDIRAWLISRYGEYVSYEPSASGVGLLLWLAPLILLAIGVLMSISLFRRRAS